MTDRELMQQALDALEKHTLVYETTEALRARLEQPEPEPHGYLWFTRHMEQRFTHRKPKEDERIGDVKPLYTAPPQREWQGLTDEEILEEYRQSYGDDGNLTDIYFAHAIEAKLKEKNRG